MELKVSQVSTDQSGGHVDKPKWYSHGALQAVGVIVSIVVSIFVYGLTTKQDGKDFGKLTAQTEEQAKRIALLEKENTDLKTEAKSLKARADDLEANLKESAKRLGESKQELSAASSRLKEYKDVAVQLGEHIKKIDPCNAVQAKINAFEERLDERNEWRGAVTGARREEVISQLKEHQQSFRLCMGAVHSTAPM